MIAFAVGAQTAHAPVGLRTESLVPNPGPRSTSIGVYRPGLTDCLGRGGLAGYKDDPARAVRFKYGDPGDVPVVGDWDGNGSQTQGVFRGGTWSLTNTLGKHHGDYSRAFGRAGDRPIVGDWDGDGTQTLGVQRGNLFLLSNSNLAPSTSYAFRVGAAGDLPVAGDWDGDGADSVGLYRSGTWLLRNSNSSGAPDLQVAFGTSSDLPVVGDWDADGRVSIGYFRAGGWYLSNRIAAPSVDVHASYGSSTDTPVVGNWGPRTQRFGDPPASLTNFFPIAVDFQPPSSFGTWKSRGINTAIRVPSGTDIEAWTSAANAHGLKMIRRARADPARDDAEANLLAFAGPDEPELNGCSADCVEAEYRRLKQSAPSKPYLVNLAGTSVLFRGGTTDPYECNRDCITRYLGAMDWVSHDIYAVNSHLPIDSIGRTLERLHRWSARRPQFAYIEASDFNNDGIRPTRDQFRAQIWDAIIHGARGISYFAVDAARPIERPDAVPADIAAEMQLQNSRITELAGVLQSTINPAAIGVQAKPPLEYSWRRVGSSTYVIVLNQSATPVDNAAIEVLGTSVPPTITVRNEGRTIPASGSTFTDSFGPYAVHVYQFR